MRYKKSVFLEICIYNIVIVEKSINTSCSLISGISKLYLIRLWQDINTCNGAVQIILGHVARNTLTEHCTDLARTRETTASRWK